MDCRLFGGKLLSAPVLGYCQLNPQEQKYVKFFNKNTKLFIYKNASENTVRGKVAILSRGEMSETMAGDVEFISDRLSLNYLKYKNQVWHLRVWFFEKGNPTLQ